ncbi:MAG: U32 family peptidase [Firmicutes bacterium]|nr:U32 family peptidase [Bacillota bacterium]
MNEIELLAPVGNEEALKAAVENGADAVYLGGKLFNARQSAANFSNEDLEDAVKYCHIRNVKVFVTVNILLDEMEINEILDYLIFLYNIDVDALIVQDLGLVKLIKETLPDFEIHASTQMTVNNLQGVKLLEELGVKRAVLARELSLEEIKYISENTSLELEIFIHGALCFSYSGQCLLSSIIGGRSGNRGRCAQPCRMPYSLIDLENDEIVDDIKKQYLLSPKDLNTIDYLNKIIKSGVTSLKIEGRMKRAEYVATIVSKYRKEVDRLLGYSADNITKEDKREIAQIFNRGFTKGFLFNEKLSNLLSTDKPNNRGLCIGEVIGNNKLGIKIRLSENLTKGDGIRFTDINGRDKGLYVKKLYEKGNKKDYVSGNKKVLVETNIKPKIGSLVYKTSDIQLLDKAKESFLEDKKRIAVSGAINIEIGKKIKFHIWDDDGNYVDIKSKDLAEKGRKVTLKKDKVIKQIKKMGNTAYYLKSLEVNLSDGVMIPSKVLNEIRRDALKKLDEIRENKNKRRLITKEDINIKGKINKNNNDSKRNISIKINSKEQFDKLDIKRLDRIYLNFTEGIEECIKKLKEYEKEIYYSTDRIIDDNNFYELDRLYKLGLTGISVSNIGSLKYVKDNFDIKIHCDFGLNVFNSLSISQLKNLKASSVTLSPELTLEQIKRVTKKSLLSNEVIGYGYLPVMATKFCLIAPHHSCDSNCNTCKFKSGYALKDRMDMKFRFTRKNKITTIYNSQALVVVEEINKIYDNNIEYVRLDFSTELEGINEIQRIYYDYAKNRIESDEVRKFVENFKNKVGITKGHYFRGVK